MTISELGSLGEFVSSIAVLVTLVYLAIQVRLARAESARSALVDRGKAVREVMAMVARDESLARGMMSATRTVGATYAPPLPELVDAGLSDLEAFRVQVHYAIMLHFYLIDYTTMDEGRLGMIDAGIAMNIANGAGRVVWEGYYRDVFRKLSPEFADHVSAVIEAHTASPPAA